MSACRGRVPTLLIDSFLSLTSASFRRRPSYTTDNRRPPRASTILYSCMRGRISQNDSHHQVLRLNVLDLCFVNCWNNPYYSQVHGCTRLGDVAVTHVGVHEVVTTLYREVVLVC